MKKTKILLIVVALFASLMLTPLQAESGIKGGIDFSKFKLSNGGFYSNALSEKNESYARIRIGAFHNFELTDNVGIQLEGYFVQKGSEIKAKAVLNEMVGKFRISYLEIPVLLKYKMAFKGADLYFVGGAYTAFRLSGKLYEQEKVDGKKVGSEGKTDVKDEFKKVDFGLVAGIGANIKLNPVDLILEARYNFGLLNVNDVKGSDVKIRNRSLSFMLGIGF